MPRETTTHDFVHDGRVLRVTTETGGDDVTRVRVQAQEQAAPAMEASDE